MQPTKLKKLEQRLESQLPLIGGCLRQRTAQALAQDGSPDAVRVLAKAIARSDDRQVSAIALAALRQIRKQQCIDEVCAVWAITRHQDLADLLIKKGWVASAPVDIKVLSALKVEQLKVITQGGAEIVEALIKALRDNDREIAHRANQCITALKNPDAIDSLCERWSKTRDRTLEQLILQGKYVARQPIEVRVLSASKVERLEVITKGGKEVVEPLIKVLNDKDREIVHRADQCITALKNPDAIDYLCERWMQTRNKQLEQAIVQQGYVARQPIEVRVLSALKAGLRSLVIEGGVEIVEPLLSAFSDQDREIISRAKQCANNLVNPNTIDYLCNRWVSTRDWHLEQVILQGGYVAQKPIDVRVLSALKTGKAQTIARDEAQIIILLLQACKDGDFKIAIEATTMLGKLRNQVAIDVLCSEWAKTRAKHLTGALQRGQYVAASPAEVRVLSALKVGKLEAVINGGTEVVELLFQACKDIDYDIAKAGQLALRKLRNPEAQEVLCRLVIEQDNRLACEVVVDCQYAPRDPNQLVIFYFLTEQWDKYESLDFEYNLLRTVYELGDEWLRKRIAQKARQAGREELVQIIAGGDKGKRLGEMTHDEWETTLEILSSGRKLEKMWQLAQAAPPIWSVRLLQQLKNAGWVPKTEFAELVQMGQKCLADEPLNSSWSCQAILHEHSDPISFLAISPDSKLLVSGSNLKNTIIRLWNLPDGKLPSTLSYQSLYKPYYYKGQEACGELLYVQCLSISPDGKLLAIGSEDCTITLWSLPDGSICGTLGEPDSSREDDGIDDLAISPDGKLLASACGLEIMLWSLPDGKFLQNWSGNNNYGYTKLAISPDSKLLANTSCDGIRLWSLPDGKLLQTLTEHNHSANNLAISPDGKLLASAYSLEVMLWSLPDGKLLQTLSGNNNNYGDTQLAISPDGKLLACGSFDGTIRLWSLPDGKPLQTLTENGNATNLAISPDSKLLACSSGCAVRLWSLPDGKPLQTLTGHSHSANNLAISSDGKLLASGSYDGTVRLWKPNLYNLSRLPVKQMSVEDIQWVQETLQDQAISEAERDWLKFIQALVSWRRRFDVEVEEAPQRIDTGEFDIEIEG